MGKSTAAASLVFPACTCISILLSLIVFAFLYYSWNRIVILNVNIAYNTHTGPGNENWWELWRRTSNPVSG